MGLEESLPAGIALTSVEKVLGLARKYSQWPVTMGLACCAIETIALKQVTDVDGNDIKVPSANCHQAVDPEIIQTYRFSV